MFSKREGILVSKLGAETHASAAGQGNKLPTARPRGSGRPFLTKLPGPGVLAPFDRVAGAVDASPLTELRGPWVYSASIPTLVSVFRRHNKLS